jgi:hypothetical protein
LGKLLHVSMSAALFASALAGCSPEALNAVANAVADSDKAAAVKATASKTATDAAAPAAKAAADAAADAAAPAAADESKAIYDKFVLKADAAKDDSRMTARLFVWAFCYYQKDKKLAKQMMTYLTYKMDLRQNPESFSGFDLTPSRDIYFRAIDSNPDRMLVHLKNGAADLDIEKAPEGVIIDDDYQAAQKGEWDSATYTKEAKYYIFTYPVGKIRSRPVALIIEDGRWKVREYSSFSV